MPDIDDTVGRWLSECAAPGRPSFWFDRYQDQPDRTAERLADAGQSYPTGGTGRADEDGCFLFAARDDDAFLASGYRMGPST